MKVCEDNYAEAFGYASPLFEGDLLKPTEGWRSGVCEDEFLRDCIQATSPLIRTDIRSLIRGRLSDSDIRWFKSQVRSGASS